MAQPPLIHRSQADLSRVQAHTRWAIGALQFALLTLIGLRETARPGTVARLLRTGRTPSGVASWRARLEETMTGLPEHHGHAAIMLAVQRQNPALDPYQDVLTPASVLHALERVLDRSRPSDEADGTESLTELDVEFIAELLEPVRAHPGSLHEQVAYLIRTRQDVLPPHVVVALQRAGDVFREATTFRGGPGFGPGPVEVADFGGGGPPPGPGGLAPDDDTVRFSHDRSWMKRLVMIAKHTYVWLDQLSKRFGREIRTLDAIPDEALAELGEAGVNGLWLIGVWERSQASRAIKQRMGNPEALASAY